MPKAKIPFGPTYDEMLNPSHQDKKVRKECTSFTKSLYLCSGITSGDVSSLP